MKRGIVIGKFMPVHAGHIALIRFAKSKCDELIVSMSFKEDDVIPGVVRFEWLKEICKAEQHIRVEIVKDDFDNELLPLSARTKLWSDFLTIRYGQLDVVISSEEYGDWLAQHLQAEHVSFDPQRKIVPVSATDIRQRPFSNWQFIPDQVKPYFVKKICFYGPESTGKSMMAKHMADHYHTEFVPEVARELVSSNEFSIQDIINIGIAQNNRVIEKSATANKILFCDTDLITTQVYCRHYLGTIPEILYELERKVKYDFYFLFDIDVPWVADGLRDLSNRRKEMYDLFQSELDKRGIAYINVKGDWATRESIIKKVIGELIDSVS